MQDAVNTQSSNLAFVMSENAQAFFSAMTTQPDDLSEWLSELPKPLVPSKGFGTLQICDKKQATHPALYERSGYGHDATGIPKKVNRQQCAGISHFEMWFASSGAISTGAAIVVRWKLLFNALRVYTCRISAEQCSESVI